MATKLEDRFVPVGTGTGAALKFRLDPDIYNATIGTILGVAATTTATEIIPMTLRLAARSSAVKILRATVERGTGEDQETRSVKLVCDKDQLENALGGGAGGLLGKTLTLGGTVTRPWTIKSVA